VDSDSEFIINLSPIDLTQPEISLLSKGLGFCPTPRSIDDLQLNQDLEQFCRRMRLKDFFFDKDDKADDTTAYNPFKPKSTWNPPKRNYKLEQFLDSVCKDIKSIKFNNRVDNLSSEERQALRSLRNNQQIVIKPADKGSAVVIQDRIDYVNEGNRQLSNSLAYSKIRSDPTLKNTKTVQSTLSKLDIDDQTISAISPNDKSVKCPLFYMLPKVHKNNNPGRPIVSGCACPTAQVSRFVDFHLRPLVEKLPSYLQDTTHFLKHISNLNKRGPFPNNTVLVSADVSALYTNIPHNEALSACKKYLDTRSKKSPPTEHLIRLLELVMSLNSFEFDGHFYTQTLGLRMGTCVAPAVANLFMGDLEASLLNSTAFKPLEGSWKRYIDDIHMLWTSGLDALEEFKIFLNQFHDTIKFTFEVSSSQVPFLDTLTQLKDGHIHTTIYSKPTDTHSYLLPSSCHPSHTFKGIPYSQALRVRRICSEPHEEESNINLLKQHLLKRQYNEQSVDTQINKARTIDHNSLLQYKPKKKTDRTPLVATYNPALNQIRQILNRHLHILNDDERLKQVFPSPPLLSFRRPRNLRDLTVSAKLRPLEQDEPPGCKRCTAKKCSVCPYVKECSKFTSFTTGESFPITSSIHCKSSWVVYLITCSACNLQYVGKCETTLYTRFSNTKSDIKLNKKKLPIVDHFNSPGHSYNNISLRGIEHIRCQKRPILMHRESFWIAKLRTLKPSGINADP